MQIEKFLKAQKLLENIKEQERLVEQAGEFMESVLNVFKNEPTRKKLSVDIGGRTIMVFEEEAKMMADAIHKPRIEMLVKLREEFEKI